MKRTMKQDSKQFPFDLFMEHRASKDSNPEEDMNVEKQKYKYGGLVARLINKNVRSGPLLKKAFGGNDIAAKIVEEIDKQRKELIEIRPNADKYIMHPFYCGLKYYRDSQVEEPDKQHFVTYYNGAKKVPTSIVQSNSDLQGYCRDIYKLLTERQIIEEIEQEDNQYEEKLDKLLDELQKEEIDK